MAAGSRSRARLQGLSPSQIRAFQRKVLNHFTREGRDLPWRKRVNPYRVLVSEIMLQQTQVDRVVAKYKEFLAAFPDFGSLAKAPTPKLLSVWSGMGYNRRALALRSLAERVMIDHGGKLPRDPEILRSLPGIGEYTAGAIMAFAFNKPMVFMDTNIRRVYIHEFFKEKDGVHDDELIPLVEQTLDRGDPRTWYNALMDYGSVLKREQANPNRRSVHYTRQSPFKNSNRQVRGAILKALVRESPLTIAGLVKSSDMDAERLEKNLIRLCEEGFIKKKGRRYSL